MGAAAVDGAAVRRSVPAWATSPKILVGGAILGVFVLLAFVGPLISPFNPSQTGPDTLAPPSGTHLLGTTHTGQDVLSQVLTGTRQTLLVGFLAAFIGEALAVVIGIAAGYAEGVVGELMAMLINVFLVIPVLPLEIVLASYLTGTGWLGITLIIAVTAWPWGARILRAQTRSIRRRDYVEAARVAGEPAWRIVGFEILPNVTALIVTGTLFHVLLAIVVQSSLAFLGIGDVSSWSWGSILYWADSATAFFTGSWWWYVPPGLCLALVGMGLALVNLGLDEVINPRLRTSGSRPPRRPWWVRATGLQSVTAGSPAPGRAGGGR